MDHVCGTKGSSGNIKKRWLHPQCRKCIFHHSSSVFLLQLVLGT
uniref:Uncharacterized protein n=1 Tax=Medicago truncatula TaxID=3880 RepID=A2Q1F3_MEDTR|nr:hypothetical protein MtrDRAFT_AC148815g25v2 [Medicago truncatula]